MRVFFCLHAGVPSPARSSPEQARSQADENGFWHHQSRRQGSFWRLATNSSSLRVGNWLLRTASVSLPPAQDEMTAAVKEVVALLDTKGYPFADRVAVAGLALLSRPRQFAQAVLTEVKRLQAHDQVPSTLPCRNWSQLEGGGGNFFQRAWVRVRLQLLASCTTQPSRHPCPRWFLFLKCLFVFF